MLLLGALGGTAVFCAVLLLFAIAVGDEFGRSLLARGWDGSPVQLIAVLGAVAGSNLWKALLGFSLFGGVIGVAFAGRDLRIRAEMEALRRTRESLLDTLLRSERYATMGGMAAEIGHELNNYLAVARAQVELFSHAVGDSVSERVDRYIDALSLQLVRMHKMTRGLMGFRGQPQSRVSCDLNHILQETVEFVTPLRRFDEVRFSMHLASDLSPVEADPQQMQQLFLNLFNNAADAMQGSAGRIDVSTRFDRQARCAEVMVSDSGPGIHPTILDHVFDAGFTTRPDGHGYGLAVCKRIVEQHGARLKLHSVLGGGTTFTLLLPVRASSSEEPPEDLSLDRLPLRQSEPTV